MAKAPSKALTLGEPDAGQDQASARYKVGMYQCDFDGRIHHIDEAARQLLEFHDDPLAADATMRYLLGIASDQPLFPPELSAQRHLHNQKRVVTTIKGNLRHFFEDYYVVSHQGQPSVVVGIRPDAEVLAEASRTVLDALDDALFVLDKDLNCVLYNRTLSRWTAILGFGPVSVGSSITRMFPMMNMDATTAYSSVFASGEPLSAEQTLSLNGVTMTVEVRLIPIHDKGAVTHVLTLARDITGRSTTEAELRASEGKYRSILENMQEGYYEVDLQGNLVFFNTATCRILGYPPEELNGIHCSAFYCSEDLEKVSKVFRTVYKTGVPAQFNHWDIVRKDGTRAVLELSVSLMRDSVGHRTGYRGIARDITDRKAAEKELHKAQETNRAIIDAMPDSFIRINRQGIVLSYKLSSARLAASWDSKGMLNSPLSTAFPEEKAKRALAKVDLALETGQIQVFEFQDIVGGQPRDFEARVVVCGQDEVMAITRDVTEMKAMVRALRESEERYREIFDSANDVIYTHDLQGRFTSLNKAGELLSGYTREEAVHKTVLSIVAPKFSERARKMMTSKRNPLDTTQYELALVAKDGSEVPVEVSTRILYKDGKPHSTLGIARDITERLKAEEERKRLEAQIQHAQKLEGLGVLAGGIAHDFNNLLVGMMGYAGLALTKLAPEMPAYTYVQRIEASAQRAAELTNQLLAYSGRGSFMIRPLDLSTLAVEMGRLLSASISKKAVLKYNCSPNLPLIEGDAAQLHQVIMNLITNASDAIGDQPGVITISTRAIQLDRTYLSKTFLNDDLVEGLYVCLEVSDTGCGMDSEIQLRIFDPFFSTKFTGRGLGLAAVLGIVRGHKGAVKVYSEPGSGTTFKILFPALLKDEPEGVNLAPSLTRETAGAWKGMGQLLVADDESTARQLAVEVLENYGFSVLAAANGKEAVELFQQHQDNIRLVILDLMMPIMNGEEAYELIHAIRPDTPVVLSSGYTEQDVRDRFAGKGPVAFIQKPYILQDLVKKLKDIMG